VRGTLLRCADTTRTNGALIALLTRDPSWEGLRVMDPRRALSASIVALLGALTAGCGTSTVSSDASVVRDAPSLDASLDVAIDRTPLDAPSDDGPSNCLARDGGVVVPVDYAALREAAAANATLAHPLLLRSRAWLTEELTHLDPTSGLLMDTLDLSATWSTRDTGADLYPFFAWEAYLLDPDAFDGPVRRVLDFERVNTLAPATGRLPYDFDTRTQRRVLRDVNDPHFGAAEYAKDGLTPIIELVGRGPFSDRMQEIELDSFQFGQWASPAGTLPVNNLEVSGDHMQSLPRLYAMTGDARYLTYAERIAQQYLVNDSYRPVDLRDHGCEIIGGFALLYAVERQSGSARAPRYEALLRNMIDYIADYGLTPEGMMPNTAHTTTRGPVAAPRGTLSDNWGQNYVAFLIYAELADEPRYYDFVDRALRNLADPMFDDYPWQETNIDGLADSMEGAMYLLAYRDVAEGQRWIDSQSRYLAARGWGPDKYGANANRTATLYVRAKTRGTWVRPWRDDVAWGAATMGDGVVVSVRADRAWTGRVTFDPPRYRETLGFARDYPRMNYLPAYFVAEPAGRYRVTNLTARTAPEEVSGAALIAGYALNLSAGERVDLAVEPVRCAP
jgi:hypothetical protein